MDLAALRRIRQPTYRGFFPPLDDRSGADPPLGRRSPRLGGIFHHQPRTPRPLLADEREKIAARNRRRAGERFVIKTAG
jgi:hypothetical protein